MKYVSNHPGVAASNCKLVFTHISVAALYQEKNSV